MGEARRAAGLWPSLLQAPELLGEVLGRVAPTDLFALRLVDSATRGAVAVPVVQAVLFADPGESGRLASLAEYLPPDVVRRGLLAAVRAGNEAGVRILLDVANIPWRSAEFAGLLEVAAGGGNLPMVRLIGWRGEASAARACSSAAANGHLGVLEWALEKRWEWDESTCASAAGGGHLAVLQWARARGCPWDASTCSRAAGGGHLAVLQWANQFGCRWDVHTCNQAARGGHLAVLQWARARGCEWNELTCSFAAMNGHLDVLEWARENGCRWDVQTCALAAANGHLGVLRWARENGCPWDEATSRLAAAACAECGEWAAAGPFPA